MAIIDFRGAYRWLSNFHMVEVTLDGITFPSTEHAYQAAKSLNIEDRIRFSKMQKPGEARRAGQLLNIRPDWESVKLSVMLDLLRQKFSYKDLQEKLIATGDEILIEDNWWGDRFWGVCRGEGKNHLGRLLMQVREEIKQAAS